MEPSETVEADWAELRGATKRAWLRLAVGKQETLQTLLLRLDFVRRIEGPQIFFDKVYPLAFVKGQLTGILRAQIGSAELVFFLSAKRAALRSAQRLEALIHDPRRFSSIELGGDVAERDSELLQYFVTTKTYERAEKGQISVVIGPKGSGKTAILQALQARHGTNSTIVITPAVFATSMLRQVMENDGGLWHEDQALVSTWIFSILIEVFKRLSTNPRGVPSHTLKRIRSFLRDNAAYEELDLFTRFIGYLKRIESVKVGPFEVTAKTKMLQELYSLAPVYEILPGLRGAGDDILILLDELDTGWDNKPHTNLFVASLLQAAIKIQGMGLKARVIAFFRLEIFDLIKDKLDQLDKLRSSIEVIRWSPGDLSDLVVRRVAHSLRFTEPRTGQELAIANALFEGSFRGMNGFDYLLSRTSLRPREVLQFAKHAHALAVEAGLSTIGPHTMAKAEEDFSTWKFEHVCSEYTHIYPGLKDLIWAFRGSGPIITEADAVLSVQRYNGIAFGNTPKWAQVGVQEVLQLLYGVEFLGVPRPVGARANSRWIDQYEFAYERKSAPVRNASSFLIHPGFWPVLEVPSGALDLV